MQLDLVGMKKALFLFASILSFLPCSLYAQVDSLNRKATVSQQQVNYRKYKWELTTGNILALLRSPTSDFGASFFIRKSVNQSVRKEFRTRKVGYRLRVNWNMDYQNRTAENYDSAKNRQTNMDYHYSYYRVGVTPGYEWQSQWNRLQVFYGVDMTMYYFIKKTSQDTSISNFTATELNTEKIKRTDRGGGIGLEPFLGVKFFITPRLSIAFETNLNLNLDFLNFKNEISAYNKSPLLFEPFIRAASYTDRRTWTNIYINPLRIIYISYYFN